MFCFELSKAGRGMGGGWKIAMEKFRVSDTGLRPELEVCVLRTQWKGIR